jgi:hypothetical protein
MRARQASQQARKHWKIARPIARHVDRKVDFVLDRDVEQGKVVEQRGRWRVANLGYYRADLEQEARLPVAQQRRVDAGFFGQGDRAAEAMTFVFKIRPSAVQFGNAVARASGHRLISC